MGDPEVVHAAIAGASILELGTALAEAGLAVDAYLTGDGSWVRRSRRRAGTRSAARR